MPTLIPNVLAQIAGSFGGDTGSVTAADIARATVISVADIASPTELGTRVGTQLGELCIAVQAVAGGNNRATIYQWDSAGAVTLAPYVMASTGGSWVAVGGVYNAGTMITVPSTAAASGFVLPHGIAPTAPLDGSCWTTTAGIFARINGVTIGPLRTGNLLANSVAAASVTGTLTETTLGNFTLPAGALATGGQLYVVQLWSHTNSAFNKTLRAKLGGTNFLLSVQTTNLSFQRLTPIYARGRTSQVFYGSASSTTTGFGSSTGAVSTAAINLDADVAVILTGQLADIGDTITLEAFTAWIKNP